MARHERVSIVYHPDFRLYDFGPYHPLRPERVDLGLDLLRELGSWEPASETLAPAPASDELLAFVHASEYVEAVQAAASGALPPRALQRFGLSSSDNPPFPDMHHAAALVAGGAAEAVRTVMRGELDHLFHPAGGLHHAQRALASGFCIYNDPALAAAIAADEFGARILYVDFDCHHGDGVQWIFYDDPRVMTLSFHESGQYLFPGTGDIDEIGTGAGEGYSANMPFAPLTQDDSWCDAIRRVVPAVIDRYRPDLLLSVHGCDTHVLDPLTHLSLSTSSFTAQARLAHELAHDYCEGRWVAFGSGGYDWRRVVPRSWAILWSQMSGRELPAELPPSWLARWEGSGEDPLPRRFRDNPDTIHPARRDEIEAANRETVDRLMHLLGLDA